MALSHSNGKCTKIFSWFALKLTGQKICQHIGGPSPAICGLFLFLCWRHCCRGELLPSQTIQVRSLVCSDVALHHFVGLCVCCLCFDFPRAGATVVELILSILLFICLFNGIDCYPFLWVYFFWPSTCWHEVVSASLITFHVSSTVSSSVPETCCSVWLWTRSAF